MLEWRMQERGLDSPELSVVATGDELPNRETAAEAKRLMMLRQVPLGRPLTSGGPAASATPRRAQLLPSSRWSPW
eukprot:1601457-Rhodomonas_salina.1